MSEKIDLICNLDLLAHHFEFNSFLYQNTEVNLSTGILSTQTFFFRKSQFYFTLLQRYQTKKMDCALNEVADVWLIVVLN